MRGLIGKGKIQGGYLQLSPAIEHGGYPLKSSMSRASVFHDDHDVFGSMFRVATIVGSLQMMFFLYAHGFFGGMVSTMGWMCQKKMGDGLPNDSMVPWEKVLHSLQFLP